ALFCGLFPPSPSGEKPVMVVKLNPASRGIGETVGKPRFELSWLACCITEDATRLKARGVSFTRFGVTNNVSADMKFWLRRFTVSPKPGTNENDGPVNGSKRFRLP